jgi:hypothetical protein
MSEEHAMEIYVHTADGEEHRFYVDDQQEINRQLQQLVPGKLYMQKQFIVAGSYFMAGFSSAEVTRVDFTHKLFETKIPPSEGREISEISDKEMARRCLPRFNDPKRSEINTRPGELLETYGEFGTVDGKRVCCRITAKAGGPLDQRQFVQNITMGQGFTIRRMGGGLIILNPELISRWALYPGLPEVPTNAWKAHRLEHQVDAHPSLVFKKMSLADLTGDEGDEQIPGSRD